jgi:predicted transglutaminase-like protease
MLNLISVVFVISFFTIFYYNPKLYKFFKIGGIVSSLIFFSILSIETYFSPKSPPVTIEELSILFICVSFIIIGFLIQIIQGQNNIIGNIRFKIGEVYIYESNESKSLTIKSIKDGNIHFYYLKPYEIETETISKFIKMLDKGIILKKMD